MTPYEDFLTTKLRLDPPSGIEIPETAMSPVLFPFQRALTRWALRRGRAGLFAHTGLGKGLMALEWTQHIDGPVLILAPLAVTHQLVREAKEKLGYTIEYVRHPDQITERVVVTNYDLMRNFYDLPFAGIVCDESSRMKHESSKTREELVKHFAHIPMRLCCTATPAPNDIAEIGNHAEFLGVMTRTEMLATFFVHDDQGWRLRGHAKDAFYRWLASWCMALRSPEDIGFDGTAFQLPPLTVIPHILPATWRREGELFAGSQLKGVTDRASVRRQTLDQRTAYAADLAQASEGSVTVWVDLDSESAAMASHFEATEVAEIYGRFPSEQKEALILSFLDGQRRILLTKPKIAGHGLNFQHAHTAVFVGLTDSWETWFQAIRRLWRYGQSQPVTIHVVLSEHEHRILENVQRKEAQAEGMVDEMVTHMKDFEQEALHNQAHSPTVSAPIHHTGPGWDLWEGDATENLQQVPDNSVGLTVSSPPFLSLYQYSATERDLGNCQNQDTFFTHLRYISNELLRVTLPGRHVAWHVSQVPAMLVRDGYIGMKDFRGELVRHMETWGWIYHGEVAITKNAQAQAIRIHAKALAFGQLKKDASWLRPALLDYICLFRKPGDNPIPIVPDVDNETWIKWANGVWYGIHDDPDGGIRETDTLNAAEAREHDDDRHICPLQLGVIERCVRLWSNPGERICDPFSGLGSTGVVALQHGRQYVGCELKPSYAQTSIKNLTRALQTTKQLALI